MAAILASGSGLSACLPRGTDEASLYSDASWDGVTATFAVLKAKVLAPRCLKCHTEFDSEAGLRDDLVPGDPSASALYGAVSTGRMPQDGPPLSSQQVLLVQRYIEQLPALSVELAPTWSSLRSNLVQSYCISCHNANRAGDFERPTLVFDTLENVEAEAAKMHEEIAGGDMPPPNSGKPRPPEAVIGAFQQWMNGGFQP